MLRKTLIFGALLAIAVSPILPTVRADAGQWKDLISEASWEYDSYQVERLATYANMQGPFELGGVVYFTQPAKSAKGAVTDKVDVTIFKDGQSFLLTDVNDGITEKVWSIAQDDRFVFRTPSTDENNWFVVSEFNPVTKLFTELLQPVKTADELSFMTLATDGDRVYTSMLHTDGKTSAVESKLSVHDYASGYNRRDFTFTLSAPWQEILDVREDNVLTEFHFNDGSKQLIIVNERARSVTEIPQSWGEAHESLVAAHFLADGSVQFFKNYRMFTYQLGDEKSVEPGGALLDWSVDIDEAFQVANHRMAWVNPDNILYVSDVNGVSNFGKVVNREYALTSDDIYFRGLDGYTGFNFATRTWTNEVFLVKDQKDDVQIGIDYENNIWYKNTSTNRLLNIGFGNDPLLTERDHAIFRGADNNIYQVTFAASLDIAPSNVEAYKAFGEPTIFLVSNNKIWTVPNESTFYSWFNSFDQVTEVTPATLSVYKDLYENVGTANYAPGTRVKSTANARVYVVGQDGQFHWVTSETVANSIWGTRWNKVINSVTPDQIWNYQIGTEVNSSNQIKTI